MESEKETTEEYRESDLPGIDVEESFEIETSDGNVEGESDITGVVEEVEVEFVEIDEFESSLDEEAK